MNAITRQIEPAEALKPHRFSVTDMYAMMAAGVIEEGGREELIEGELIEMPGDGPLHNQLTNDLGYWIYSALSRNDYAILPNSTLVLSEFDAPSPDWCVSPASVPMTQLRGSDALLVIEQADSSLKRDLGWKAALYARNGVREYWVIDVHARMVHVHRDPQPDGYGYRQRFATDSTIEALLIPGLSLCLETLGHKP